MSKLEFRKLKANEIECRASIKEQFIEISLHIKAHVCTRILNEEIGPMDWTKSYENNNKNCTVSIWDSSKNMWISKQDCGGPLTEKDGLKGQASNGFKRACSLGWGIGIELYTQPQILINKTDENIGATLDNQEVPLDEYFVSSITTDENKVITALEIKNNNDEIVYQYPTQHNDIEDNLKDVDMDHELIVKEVQEEDNIDNEELSDEDKEKILSDLKLLLMKEIKRTHVRASDVFKKINVNSIEEIEYEHIDSVNLCIQMLQERPSYIPKVKTNI